MQLIMEVKKLLINIEADKESGVLLKEKDS